MKCLVSEKSPLFLNIYPELGLEKQSIGIESNNKTIKFKQRLSQ